jgi:ribosomal protein S18 acetylase RimI-like enzyme
MEIRAYQTGDLRRMKLIAPRAFMGLGLARYAIDHELDRARVEDYYSREIQGYAARVEKGEDGIQILVATDGDELRGYIVVALDPTNAEQFGLPWGKIVSLAVDPGCQFRGIGKALVARGLEWLSSMKVRYVEVLTDQNNVAAQRAYEANGFRAVYASISFSRRLEPSG